MPIFAFTGSLTRPAPQYAGANGRGITSFAFDAATGQLREIAAFGGIDDTAWLTVDTVRGLLYATCEVPGAQQSSIAAFAVDPASGLLTPVSQRPTGGNEACHASLSADGTLLFVANYNGAVPAGWPDQSVTAFPLDDSAIRPAAACVRHKGSGPNAARQMTAHAHCVIPSPDGRFIYVADLGADRIVAYAVGDSASPSLTQAASFAVPPGMGPRHLVFRQDGKRLFMVSELIATVLSLEVDPATGAMTQLASLPIARTGEAIVQPAGILLTADARYLFVGLRQCDEILGLAIDPASGRLTQTGRWPSGGATPRDFALSPDGRFLVVVNQDSDRVTVFPVHGGRLGAPVQNLDVGTPMSIKFMAVPA